MAITNTLTFGKLQKLHGWELEAGACILTAQFVKTATSTDFPLTNTYDESGDITTPAWSWAKRSDAQKLIDLFDERAKFLGSNMTATASAGQQVLEAANFAKLQEVYTTATNIQYLLHPAYKGGDQSASGVTFTNNDFPTFAELNSSNGTIDEGIYQWWYELCKFAGLISTNEGVETWGFSYRDSNTGNIVRPGSSGSGINALRVVTVGDQTDPVVNKKIIEELLALANIEHSQKIKVEHTGTTNTQFSDANTVDTMTSIGTVNQKTRTSDCDSQNGIAELAGGGYSRTLWEVDCALGFNDGLITGTTANPFGQNDVRGNYWFATNNTASISAISSTSKTKSAYCFASVNAKYKADCTADDNTSIADSFMDLEMEYSAGELDISGNYTTGFVARSRGQQNLALGSANVPVTITGYHVYIRALTDSGQTFRGNRTKSSDAVFTEGWNSIDITDTVTSGAADTVYAGISFIDGLKVNPIADEDFLMTNVPEFENADFTKMTTGNISINLNPIDNQTGAEEDDCAVPVNSGQISISITDLDSTTLSVNHSANPSVFFCQPGILILYTGLHAPTSSQRFFYQNFNSLQIVTNAEIRALGEFNYNLSGEMGAGLGGTQNTFTDTVSLQIAVPNIASNYFGLSAISDSESYTFFCNERVATTTTTTTAEGGS